MSLDRFESGPIWCIFSGDGDTQMFLLSFLLVVGAGDGQSYGDNSSYYLNGESFTCLVRHASNIARSNARLVTIDLRRCPPRVSERMNSWPRLSVTSSARVDLVIVLTRNEVACLRQNRDRPELLRQPAGANRYRLTLPCPR